MKYYIVKENSNYADEFDIEGFKLCQATSIDQVKQDILEQYADEDGIDYPLELYFGSNESQSYNSEEELFNDLIIQEISEIEYNSIIKILGKSYGTRAILL